MMSTRGRLGLLVAAVSVLILAAGVQLAMAHVARFKSTVTIRDNPSWHGRVTSSRTRCLRHRTVEVRDASGDGLYDSTTTDFDGRWELLSSPGTHGTFYAVVKRRVLRNT